MAKRGNPNWAKGKSGNPGGQRKGYKSSKSYLIQKYGLEARPLVDVLDRFAMDVAICPKDRILAVRELLARHSGQPPQSVDVTSGGQTLPTITVIEVPVVPK